MTVLERAKFWFGTEKNPDIGDFERTKVST